MIPQRSGFKRILKPIAENRIKLNQCPACALPKEKWKRRKDWTCCSADCTEIFWDELVIYNGWNDLRKKVLIRDNYRCVKCGSNGGAIHNDKYGEFVADHIQATALGGDEWDINNIQTLCKICNKIKTKEDMSKIAIARRKDKQINVGQTFLK